jgi:hypothetical protein
MISKLAGNGPNGALSILNDFSVESRESNYSSKLDVVLSSSRDYLHHHTSFQLTFDVFENLASHIITRLNKLIPSYSACGSIAILSLAVKLDLGYMHRPTPEFTKDRASENVI